MSAANACARDPWLDRWQPLLHDAAARRPVLELGCDTGVDSAWLLSHGFAVAATDISADALAQSAHNAPGALRIRHDLQQPMPFADATFNAVLASLCLHYFRWQATLDMVAEIRRCIARDGVLLCRLNSTADVHHGATGYEEIEPHYYRVNGRYGENKRFFDRAAVQALFARGWEFIHIEELTNHRYTRPKVAWEAVLRAI